MLNRKVIKFQMNPAWSSRANDLIDAYLKIKQNWYDSSLELKSSLFDWFLIEKRSNWIWIQPEAQELMIWLILNWKMTNFIRIQPGALQLIICLTLNWRKRKNHMNPARGSRAHYLIDSWLKMNQRWYESRLELESSLFDWFSIHKWSTFIWIQPGGLQLIIW